MLASGPSRLLGFLTSTTLDLPWPDCSFCTHPHKQMKPPLGYELRVWLTHQDDLQKEMWELRLSI